MTSLMLTAESSILEQIATIATNIAHKDGKEIKLQSINDERYKSYQADVKAIQNGELDYTSTEQMLDEIEKWY